MGKSRRMRIVSLRIFVFILVFLFPVITSARLNENCTVSVLNRTAQVKADGTWVIPNVPSNMGKVRVRATCVENGITRSGQSDWVFIPTDGTIKVGDIPLDAPEPVPEDIFITVTSNVLTSIGVKAQLTVLASYPDGTVKDVTHNSKGTVYATTNRAIATVTENGLVTAIGTGKVIITASNELLLSSIMFTITQENNPDADNDGIPDEWELSHGLNPNDPIDAIEDPDSDGLSSKQEYDLGTEVFVADSDSDGILDGEEVLPGKDGFTTNPLLADSDGDGIKDGLEVRTGSDPTNSASYNLASALSKLEISPANFVIVFNTITGEATRQLSVTGILTDGTELDLTSSLRGTNYNSSDLTIANFAVTDGLVYAGQSGAAVITASNNGFNASARVTVKTFSPTALSYLDIPYPGYANNVDVSGNYAYVADGPAGLLVVDVSNPLTPGIVGTLDTSGNANDVRVVGNLAYVADGISGLQIIDVTSPALPTLAGFTETPGVAWDVAIAGNYAYIADGDSGLQIIDISNPAVPLIFGSYDTPGTAKGVDVSGNVAVVADDSNGVRVIDITDPANPQSMGVVSTYENAVDLAIKGNTAFVAYYPYGGLKSVDIGSPASPAIISTETVGGYLFDVAIWGSFAFGADVLRVNAVPVYDITTPGNIIFRAVLDFSQYRDDNGTGVAVTQNYLFLTASRDVQDNGVNYNGDGYTRLYIGQYAEISDNGGISPTINVSSPLSGAEVMEGTTLSITASAADDVAVASVNILIDDEIVSTDTTSPYHYNYQVPMGINSLAVGATAIDLANNTGTAQDVFITVIPDPPPVVNITAPAAGATFIEGNIVTISATATDNTSVTQVEFLINGTVVSTDTTAPYQYDYVSPIGTTGTVTIGVRATDTRGKAGTGEVSITITPDPAPVVSITAPANGATVIQGTNITISATATDNTEVKNVELIVNGTVIAVDTSSPYQTTYAVPSGINNLTIGARGTDNLGRIGSASDIVVTAIPDPGTTVTGRVLDDKGVPVAGADVITLGGLSGTTGADGRFSIPGVSSIQGAISVSASATIAGVVTIGSSSSVTAVTGGISDVGDVVITAGLVWTWGANVAGQLGNGTNSDSIAPVQVSGLSSVTAIAAGEYHTIALKNDNKIVTWGANFAGQLGNGTTTDSTTPVLLSGISNVTAIAGGRYHTITLKNDGTVWTWGYNSDGGLGDGTNSNSNIPVQVTGLSGISAIAGGGYHTIAIKNDGTVWAWGSNWAGQLGNGATDNSNIPVQVSGLSGVSKIAGGVHHSLALKNDGTVWGWGYNYYGQLADGTQSNRNTPVQVSNISSVIAIAGGQNHSVALKNDGTVWTWGRNDYYQLGDGTSNNTLTPIMVNGLTNIIAIAAGETHSIALKNDGTVWTWGTYRSAHEGAAALFVSSAPVQVGELSSIIAVAGGGYHAVALK